MLSSVIFKTLFFYFFVHLTYKIMGKREVGELSTFDFVVSIMIAELTAISIESSENNIFEMSVPIFLLMLLQITIAFLALKSTKIRDYFDGKPSFIIINGKVNIKEMKKQRYNLDDLLVQLRNKKISSLLEVRYAILENNGELSIFAYEDDILYPLPIILDGCIQRENLIAMSIDESMILQKLEEKNLKLKKVFYCGLKNNQDLDYILK